MNIKPSPHITAQGYALLHGEFDDQWRRRAEVVVHLSAAAAEGDRSENAEYIYRKKELRELDRRIRYLERRLPELQVVERRPDEVPDQVFFGATVRLMDEAEQLVTYRVVGADEFDPQNNLVSIDSPMARALLKKAANDEVRVRTPMGEKVYRIIAVCYQ